MPDPVSRPCEVLCVGLIVADHVSAPISRMPESGGLVMTPKLELTIGGCAANAATDLARLGVNVGIVGRIGKDVLGSYVRDRLAEAGVRCDHLSVSETAQTAATLVVNVKGEDRRFIHALGANAELTGLEADKQAWSAAKVAYVGGFGLNAALSGENVAAIFRRVRASGGTTVLDVTVGDPEAVRPMLTLALPEADFFLPNYDEAKLLTGQNDPQQQVERFLQYGARHVVITCGSKGAILADAEGRREELPAYDVEQVDGTGGGDAFAAGLIYGLLQNADLDLSLKYGAALGASCVRAAGATTGVFTEAELLEFIERPRLT